MTDLQTSIKYPIDEKAMEGLRIVEIKLNSFSHSKLAEELEKDSNTKIGQITTLFGVPVVITKSVPNDRAYVIGEIKMEKVGVVTQK